MMIKRILGITLSISLLFSLYACGSNKTHIDAESSTEDDTAEIGDFSTRAEYFYDIVNKNFFCFEAKIKTPDSEYSLTQATDGSITTTITSNTVGEDSYEIYDGKYIYSLDIDEKKYETTVGKVGQAFLFEGYTPDMFRAPKETGIAVFEDGEYYCEVFSVISESSDVASVDNYYYFSETTLIAIESYENNRRVMSVKIGSYTNSIPEGVYLAPPDDFTKGSYNIETNNDYSTWAEAWN